MVNFNNVEIVRAIMHRVSAKTGGNASQVFPSNELLNLDDDAKQIIKERLVAAFGRQSKSFELEIEDDGANSCFNTVKSLRGTEQNNQQFINLSTVIAQKLADSQRLSRIPGGFLLVVHCRFANRPLFVLIKAEPHAALGVTQLNVQTIKDIILSPEQKLYKAVYYEQKRDAGQDDELTKNDYKVVLFDNNVSTSTIIAQYFFKDFLGLSIDRNSKLQTCLFYQKMNEKIWKEIAGIEAINASDALRVSVVNNANITINPHDVINDVIPLEYRDSFINDIVEEFPHSFSKDTSLIDVKLGNKTITLSENVKISAPSQFFDDNVQVTEEDGAYMVRIQK